MSFKRNKLRKKANRRWKSFFLFVLLCIIGAAGYSIYQYQAGVLESQEKLASQQEFEFNGETANKDRINVLLLGSDARKGESARADTIMIGSYQPDLGTYKLISIMRDAYVDIPGHGKDRINAAFSLGGPELVRETIKRNFALDLKYYVIVNFEGFVQFIDEAFPTGVEVFVEKKMSKNIGVTLEPGLQKLDGERLLGYVRFRHDAIGDFGRVERQQEVVKEISSQLIDVELLTKLPKLLGIVSPYINTNMKTSDIVYLGKDFLVKGNRSIDVLTIPVDGSWESKIIDQKDVLAIDIEKNKQLLHEFLDD